MMPSGTLIFKQLHTICVRPTHSTALQIPRALVVSALAAGVDVLGYVLLVQLAGWTPPVAAVLSYLIGGVIQYLLCCWWVFPVMPSNQTVSFLLFTLLSLGGLVITWGVIRLLNGHWEMHYLLAKGVALGLAFCWNFGSRKVLIFRERARRED